MKEKYNPKQYWKEKLEFDSDKEILIYQYVCGNIKRNKLKHLDQTKRYREYRAWKEHVEAIIQSCDNDNLLEFYHFIKFKARICNNIIGIHTYFAIPFSISIIAGWFIPKLLDLNPLNDIQMQQFTFVERIILLSVYCFTFFVFLMIIAFSFIHFIKEYINAKNEIGFWEDYLEIIDAEIEKRKC